MKLKFVNYFVLFICSVVLQDFLFGMKRDAYKEQVLSIEEEKLSKQKHCYNKFSNLLRKEWVLLQKKANQNLLEFFTGGSGKEGYIKLWEHLPFEVQCDIASQVRTFGLKRIFKSKKEKVSCVKFSSDEKLMVTGYTNGQVTLWNAKTRKLFQLSGGHDDDLKNLTKWINCIDISLNGQTIVTYSPDHTVRVWDAKTGQQRYTFNNYFLVRCVGIMPDEKNIVICCYNGEVIKWNPETGTQSPILKDCNYFVTCADISSNKKRIVIGLEDGTAVLWGIKTRKQLQILKGHNNRLTCISISSDGKIIVTGDTIGRIIVWDAETGKQLWVLKDHDSYANCINISPNGKQIAVGYSDHVEFWDAEAGKLFHYDHQSDCMDISRNGKRVMTSFWDGTLKIWERINYSEYEFPLLKAWRQIKKEELSKEEIFKNIRAFLPNILYSHNVNGELVFLRGNAELLLSYLQNRFPDDDRVKRFKLFIDKKSSVQENT